MYITDLSPEVFNGIAIRISGPTTARLWMVGCFKLQSLLSERWIPQSGDSSEGQFLALPPLTFVVFPLLGSHSI